jgi:hypothetical protein
MVKGREPHMPLRGSRKPVEARLRDREGRGKGSAAFPPYRAFERPIFLGQVRRRGRLFLPQKLPP